MFYERVMESTAYLKDRLPRQAQIGIILGSGLGGLVDLMENKTVIPYESIPNFPRSTVAGHAGNLVLGDLGSQTVLAMQGRFHFYEGFSMREVTYPLYVMKQLGIDSLIVTNAAGGINRNFAPGDLMLLTDHINFLGTNPLIGSNDERFGPRFPDLSEAYAAVLIEKAKSIANNLGILYQTGTYLATTGPSYETGAEIRAFAAMGADAVGMSTVPEVIVANYLGMKVLGISCITNMATGIAVAKHSHTEVMRIANESSARLCAWVKALVEQWDQSVYA